MPLDPTREQVSTAERVLARLMAVAPLRRPVTLRWRPFRTTAGRADLAAGELSLSLHLLTTPERIEITLAHEYAHFLVYEAHGRRAAPHCERWRETMMALGYAPERCHAFEAQRNRPRRLVRYRCARCTAEFDRLRRFQQGVVYLHRGCGGVLEFVGIVPVAAPNPNKPS
ncbi:MAG: SprT-like domain-containing protein [Fimbriimonadaceae bacterium]